MPTGEKLVILAALAGLAGLAYASARADNEATNQFLRQKWGEISGQVSTYAQEIWQQMQEYDPRNPKNQWYGTALTPTQLVEYVEEKATPSPLPSPSPTATKTPEPTATPTPEPTPTPEVTPTVDVGPVLEELKSKLEIDRTVVDKFIDWSYAGLLDGSSPREASIKNLNRFVGFVLKDILGVEEEIIELLSSGYTIYGVLESEPVPYLVPLAFRKYSSVKTLKQEFGTPALFGFQLTEEKGNIKVTTIIPLNEAAAFYLNPDVPYEFGWCGCSYNFTGIRGKFTGVIRDSTDFDGYNNIALFIASNGELVDTVGSSVVFKSREKPWRPIRNIRKSMRFDITISPLEEKAFMRIEELIGVFITNSSFERR